MATSHGTYSQWELKFNPQNPKTPWDDKVWFCGEDKVKRQARAEICDEHGETHENGCIQCQKHKIALSEPPTCGKKWVGGRTCFNCQNDDAIKLLKPRKEYLEYNEYCGPIPQELKIFWAFKEAEHRGKPNEKISVHEIISRMGTKIPKIPRDEKYVQRRVVRPKL